MSRFFRVFNFENKIRLKQKSFIISLALLFVIGIMLNLVPAIISNSGSAKDKDEDLVTKESMKDSILLLDSKSIDKDLYRFLSDSYKITLVNSFDEMKKNLEDKSGNFICGIELIGMDKAKIIGNSSSFSNTYDQIQESLNTYKRQLAYKKSGINPSDVDKISKVGFEFSVETFGRDPVVGTILADLGNLALYLIVIIFGGLIATSVCREKESRTMELLVTNVKPKYLIIGKVFSGVFLGLVNVLVLFVGGFIGLYLSKYISKSQGNFVLDAILKIGLDQIGVFFIFLILGTLLYYMMFAASASLVSKIEEVNAAVLPVITLIMISYFLTMFGRSNPDTFAIKLASFIPFSSPMAMFLRYCVGNVDATDLLISILILIVTIIIVSILAVKIYRFGSLNYGNKVGIRAIIKGLKED